MSETYTYLVSPNFTADVEPAEGYYNPPEGYTLDNNAFLTLGDAVYAASLNPGTIFVYSSIDGEYTETNIATSATITFSNQVYDGKLPGEEGAPTNDSQVRIKNFTINNDGTIDTAGNVAFAVTNNMTNSGTVKLDAGDSFIVKKVTNTTGTFEISGAEVNGGAIVGDYPYAAAEFSGGTIILADFVSNDTVITGTANIETSGDGAVTFKNGELSSAKVTANNFTVNDAVTLEDGVILTVNKAIFTVAKVNLTVAGEATLNIRNSIVLPEGASENLTGVFLANGSALKNSTIYGRVNADAGAGVAASIKGKNNYMDVLNIKSATITVKAADSSIFLGDSLLTSAASSKAGKFVVDIDGLSTDNTTTIYRVVDSNQEGTIKNTLASGNNFGLWLYDGDTEIIKITKANEGAKVGETNYYVTTLNKKGIYLINESQATLYVETAAAADENTHLVGYNSFANIADALKVAAGANNANAIEIRISSSEAVSDLDNLLWNDAFEKDVTITADEATTVELGFAAGDKGLFLTPAADTTFTIDSNVTIKTTGGVGHEDNGAVYLNYQGTTGTVEVDGTIDAAAAIKIYGESGISGILKTTPGHNIVLRAGKANTDITHAAVTFGDVTPKTDSQVVGADWIHVISGDVNAYNTTISAIGFKYDNNHGATAGQYEFEEGKKAVVLNSEDTIWNFSAMETKGATYAAEFNFTGGAFNVTGTGPASTNATYAAEIGSNITVNLNAAEFNVVGGISNAGTIQVAAASKLIAGELVNTDGATVSVRGANNLLNITDLDGTIKIETAGGHTTLLGSQIGDTEEVNKNGIVEINTLDPDKGVYFKGESTVAAKINNNGRMNVGASTGDGFLTAGIIENNDGAALTIRSGSELIGATITNNANNTITVNGGTLDGVTVNNGTITSTGFTFEGKSALNGVTVAASGKTITNTDSLTVTGTVTATGAKITNTDATITINAGGSISAGSVKNGTIVLDTTKGSLSGNLINLVTASLTGIDKLFVKDAEDEDVKEYENGDTVKIGNNTYSVIIADTGISLGQIYGTLDNLLVDATWSTYAPGSSVSLAGKDGTVGYNAFSNVVEALGVAYGLEAGTEPKTVTIDIASSATVTAQENIGLGKYFANNIVLNGVPANESVTVTIPFKEGDYGLFLNPADSKDVKIGSTLKIKTTGSGANNDSGTVYLGFNGTTGTITVDGAIEANQSIKVYDNTTVNGSLTTGDAYFLYLRTGKYATVTNQKVTFAKGSNVDAGLFYLASGAVEANEATITAQGFLFSQEDIAADSDEVKNKTFTLTSNDSDWTFTRDFAAGKDGNVKAAGVLTFNRSTVSVEGKSGNVAPNNNAAQGEVKLSEGIELNLNDADMTVGTKNDNLAGSVTNDGTINLEAGSMLDVNGAVTNKATGVINVGKAGDANGSELSAASISNEGTINVVSESGEQAQTGAAVTVSGAVNNTNAINVGDEDSKAMGTLTAASITNSSKFTVTSGSNVKTTTGGFSIINNGGTFSVSGKSTVTVGGGGYFQVNSGELTVTDSRLLAGIHNSAKIDIIGSTVAAEGTGARPIQNYGTLTVKDESEVYATTITNRGTFKVFNSKISGDSLNVVTDGANIGKFLVNQDYADASADKTVLDFDTITNAGVVSITKAKLEDTVIDNSTEGAKFEMIGGSISGSTVTNAGTFNMIGGTITGSTVQGEGAFNLSNEVTLAGENKENKFEKMNIAAGAAITVNGTLTVTSSIANAGTILIDATDRISANNAVYSGTGTIKLDDTKVFTGASKTLIRVKSGLNQKTITLGDGTANLVNNQVIELGVGENKAKYQVVRFDISFTLNAIGDCSKETLLVTSAQTLPDGYLLNYNAFRTLADAIKNIETGTTSKIEIASNNEVANQTNLTVAAGIAISSKDNTNKAVTIGFKGADQGLYLNPGDSIAKEVSLTTTATAGDAWTGSVYVNYAAAAGDAVELNGNIDAAGHIYFNGAATVTGDLKVANDRIVLLRAGKAGADNAVTIGRENQGTTAQVTGTWIELLSGKANFNNTIVDVSGLAYNNYTPVDGEYAAAPALVSDKTKWTLGFIQLDKAGLKDASFTFQNESTVTVNDAHGQNADHKAAAIGSGITFTLDESSLTMTNADSVFNNAGTINLKNKAELTTNKLENIGTITTTDDTATVISATNIANGDTTKASIIEVGKLTATSSIVNNNGKVAVRGSTIHVADALDATGATIDNGLEAITPGTDAPACKAVIEAKTITAVSISNFGVIGSQTAELKHTLATITLTGDLTNGQYGNVMADSLTAANIVNSNELLVNAIDVTGTITNNAGAAIALNSGEGSTGHITIEADGSLTNAGYIKTLSGGSITVNALVNTGAAANNASFTSSELLGNSTLTLNNGLISTDSITVGTSITNSGTISAKSIQAAQIFSTSAGSVLEVANSIKQTNGGGFNFTNAGSLTLGSADDTELNTLTAAAILQNQSTGTITLNKVNASVKAINNSHSFTATGSVFTTNSGYETVNYANASFTLTNSTFTGKIDNRGTFTMNGGTLNAATLKNTGTFTLVGDFTKTVGDETVNTLSIGTLTGELTFKGVKLNGYTLESDSGAINVAGADATSFSGVNTFYDFSIASTGTLAIDAAETVSGHGPSLVVKHNFDNKGKITIDVTNLQWGTAITSLKVISVAGTLSSNSNIEITGTNHDDTMAVIMNTGDDMGIYLVKGKPVSIPTIALNSAWSNCHVGDKVTIGQKEFIYGSSAFATIGDIVVTPDTTEIMVVGQTTEYEGTLSLNGQKLSIVSATDATAASAATFGALSFTGAVDVFANNVTATTATTFAAGAKVDLSKTTASLGAVTVAADAASVTMNWNKALTVASVTGNLNVAIDVTDYAGLSADKVVVDVTGAAPANVTYSVIGTGSTNDFFKYFKKNNDTGDVSINAAARNLITVTNAADIMSATKGVNYSWTVGDDTYFADRVVIDTAIAGTGINAQYLQGNGSAITFVGDYTHAKAVYGGKLVTAVKDDDIKTLTSDLGGNINITIDGNSTFNQFVFGGDRIDVRNANKGRNTFYRDADISLTINGGTFMRDVAAGMMFQGDYTKAAFEVNNTSLKITGGTFKEYVYGGNYATSNTASKKTTILEKATVTLVAGNDIDFEKTLFVGSIGNGNIFEGTELKLTGSNVDENFNQIAKLHASDIWGASAADKIITDGDTRILVGGVEGTRQLTFTGFTGIVDSKNIHGFSDVLVEKNSTAKLNETVNLSDVSNWTFEADSKLLGKFKNDFAGDKLALTGITAETNNWQLFEATGFTGAADLQVSFNGGDFVAYESGINGWSNGDYMLSASNWTYGLQSELAPAQLS